MKGSVTRWVLAAACGAGVGCSPEAPRCGPGTVVRGAGCGLAPTVCGAGTVVTASGCGADLAALCGAGTVAAGPRCVAAAPTRICGAGTVEAAGECRAAQPALACGPGTVAAAGECRPAAELARCGPGTALEGGVCVAEEAPPPCGAGTEAEGGICVAVTLPPPCGPDTEAAADGRCVPAPGVGRCGPGTAWVDGDCAPLEEPAGSCGPGTLPVDGGCALDPAVCGPGTALVDGRCEVSAAACGPGTVLTDGICVAAGLACGPGTAEVAGECVAEGLRCGPGTVAREGLCHPRAVQWVALPFAAGTELRVSQGHFGFFSHSGRQAHAVDFPVVEGTWVVAARGGTVLAVKDDSNEGCAEPRCAPLGNFITVDHGDGTFGSYYHLQQGGAGVVPGQAVCAGERLGRSGNTGFTSGPHLHFAVVDVLGYSLPLRFEGLAPESNGLLHAGRIYQSQSPAVECPRAVAWSTCPQDAFAHLGVQLLPGVPCAAAPGGVAIPVAGRVTAPGARLLISQFDPRRGRFDYRCEATDPQGWFRTELRFFGDVAFSYLVFAAALPGQGCEAVQGWDGSPYIWLLPP